MPKVRIQCSQRVRYDQVIMLSEGEAEELERIWSTVSESYDPKTEHKLTKSVDGLIDHADVEDGEDLEDIEIEFLKDK